MNVLTDKNSNINLIIFSPNQSSISLDSVNNSTNQDGIGDEINHKFTTNENGNYQFCFYNKGNQREIYFKLSTAINKEIKESLTQETKSFEAMSGKLTDKMELLLTMLSSFKSFESMNYNLFDGLENKILITTGIIIIVMSIIAITSLVLFKDYLRKRKII